MKNVLSMVAVLVILFFVNGCGDKTKDVAKQPAGMSETATVAGESTHDTPAVAEAENTAKEAVTEKTTETATAVEAAAEEAVPAAEATAEASKSVAAADEAVDPDAVVVTVNGQKVTEKEVSEAVDKMAEMQKKRMPPGMQLPDSMTQKMRKGVVDNKVDMILLSQRLKEKGIRVSDEQVTKELQNIADQQGMTMEKIQEDIAKSGMTIDDVKEQIEHNLQIKMLMEAETPSSVVTEADAKKFYDDNPKYFENAEQVKASHILCGKRGIKEEDYPAELEKIKAAKARLDAGETFEDVAKDVSTCPSASKGGDLGFFGKGQMDPAFEKAAFELEVGKTSAIVKSSFGYHIIKVTDKKEAGKTPFEEVKAKITQFLTQQKQNQFWSPYREAMLKDATIEYSAKEQALRDELEKAAAARAAERQAQMEKASAAQKAKAAAPKAAPAETAEK